MATFTINFQANTTGIHHVGYRTYNDPLNTYNVVDVNVTVPGLQAVTITVPGNLFCAYDGIIYTGYVIAACQDQTISGGDGIPDFSVTWTVTMEEQIDPWQMTQILCEGTPINTLTIVIDGLGLCSPAGDYPLIFTPVTGGDQIELATGYATVAGGHVTNLTLTNPGRYKVAPLISHNIPLCDTEPEFTATIDAACTTLMLSDYACNGHNDVSADSQYEFHAGDLAIIGADPTTLGGLMAEFTVSPAGAYHCQECERVNIAVNPGTGVGKITYQTCWDGSNPYGSGTMVSKILTPGLHLDLGCVIGDTVKFDEGTLSDSLLKTTAPCVIP